jgi:cell division protein FtsQ
MLDAWNKMLPPKYGNLAFLAPSTFSLNSPFGPEPLGLERLDLSSSASLVAERLTAEGLLPEYLDIGRSAVRRKQIKGKEAILRKQVVRRKKPPRPASFWTGFARFGLFFFRGSCVLIGIALLSLLFIAMYEYLLTSPYVKLEQIIVKGVREDLKQEIIKLSCSDADASLLAINLGELKAEIERHPWIKAARLEKRFPHTLVIEAEQEHPRAIVALDRLYFMNRLGTLFKEVDLNASLDYPIITFDRAKGPLTDKHLALAAHVLDAVASERGPWSLQDLSEVHLKSDGRVSLYFQSLPAAIHARTGDLAVKLVRLRRVLEDLRRTGRIHLVRTIDLNVRDGAVVSFKNG